MTRFLLSLFCATFLMTSVAKAHNHEGQDPVSDNVAEITQINNDISVVQAGGGNILVLFGDEGLFLIDNGLSDKSAAVMAAIKEISDKPVKYLVNTHWHYDHTGNNHDMGGAGTTIIAHDNVRKRLEEGGTIAAFDKLMEPATKDALPVITYDEGVNLYINGHKAEVEKLNPAHTDGDSYIYFKEANVLHAGDIFFNGFFPFIDASSGGNLKGMIAAVDVLLARVNATTKIIPGHGPIASKVALENYKIMLNMVSVRLQKAKTEGLTKEEWVAAKPLEDLDAEWGDGFLPTDKFTEIVWDTL